MAVGDEATLEYEERLTPLREQWPYLRFLGLGVWWAWIWLCYNSLEIVRMFPAEAQTPLVLQMYLFSTLGIGVSMFGAACTWKRTTALVDKRWFVVAFGALAGLATILLGFSTVMGGGAFFVSACVLTGIGTSVLCLKAGRIYGSISLGDSLTAGAISLLLAAMLYFVGVGVPEQMRLFFIAALPLAAALLLTMGAADPFPSALSGAAEQARGSLPERRVYRKLVAASAIVAFTAGVGRGITSAFGHAGLFTAAGSVTVLCVGVIGIVIVVVVNRGDAVRGARRVYSGLIVLGVAMMLASCFGFDISYLSVGKESLWMVFSCFMAYLAFRYNFSAVRVFGIGQGMYFLASAVGWAVGGAIAPYYGDAAVRMGVGVALAFLVVVVLVYVFPENDLKRIMARSVDADQPAPAARSAAGGAEGEGPASAQPAVLASDAASRSAVGGMPDALAEPDPALTAGPAPAPAPGDPADPRYGLSARELEILDLFAQGRSANWIAEHLTISKNTVRSHLRAIYTKLDVHTRQELLDFLAGKRA